MKEQPIFEDVSTQKHQEMLEVKKNIEAFREMTPHDNERGLGVNLLEDLLLDENTPRASKLEIFKSMFDLFPGRDPDINEDVVVGLIDNIRLSEDPDLRIRYLSIISHDVQTRYIKELDAQTIVKMGKMIDALQSIATNHPDPVHRAYASLMLNPRSGLEIFNELYNKDNDIATLPRVEEADITIAGEISDSGSGPRGTKFTGDIMALNPRRLPTWGKIEQYENILGKPLPVYVVRNEGEGMAAVELPEYINRKLLDDVGAFRDGAVTRKEVFDNAELASAEFLKTLTPEQLQDFTKARIVQIRFGTERSESPSITTPLEHEPPMQVENRENKA